MEDTLRRMRNRRVADDRGFTLIELLVVVVIIGVLVAIAVPMYLNYRKGAANKSAESDLRSAVSAVEQFYTENNNTYPDSVTGAAGVNVAFDEVGGAAAASPQTATVSPGNIVGLKNEGATYILCAKSSDGGNTYIYDSSKGGSVKKSTQADVAACLANEN
jgi:type IV pilus assembly protein PilA